MFDFVTRGYSARPATGRGTRLGFDVLESRDCPSAWDVPLPPGHGGDGGTVTLADPGDPGRPAAFSGGGLGGGSMNTAPRLVEFDVEHSSFGWLTFTGRVEDEHYLGLYVTFGGVPTMEGRTVTVGPDGYFSLMVQLRTDGSDAGTVSAIATDSGGLRSNEECVPVNP